MLQPLLLVVVLCGLLVAATPPWPHFAHDASRSRFAANGPAIMTPWTTNTNYSFTSSLGPAVDSNGVSYIVADNGDGCEVVSFNPLDGSTSVVFTCPTGAALSFYTGLVITNNNGQDVLLFPLLLANGWAMVALTTTGRALWSALVYPVLSPPVVSNDGSQVFLLTQRSTAVMIIAIDTLTGALNWNVSLQAFAASEQNTLQLFADNDGAVYAATLRGHNYQYYNVSLWRLNQETGQELWHLIYIASLPTPIVFSPAINALGMSIASGLVAIDIKTGKQLFRAPLPLATCLGILMCDPVSGNFYLTCQDSTLLALDSSGSLLWTYVIRTAPGGLGELSMSVRSPSNGTDAGSLVYNGQANDSNLSVPFVAVSSTGSLLWSKSFDVQYPTVYMVGPNVCVYFSAGSDINPTVSLSCFPGSFTLD